MGKHILKLTASWLIVSGIVTLFSAILTDKYIIKCLQYTIQSDFDDRVHYLQNRITFFNGSFSKESEEHGFLFQYTWQGELIHRNTFIYVPDSADLNHLLKTEKNEIFNVQNRIFYVIKRRTKNHIFLGFVSLRVTYPIQNNYLRDYVYAGRWEHFFTDKEINSCLKLIISQNPLAEGININDVNDQPLFGLVLSSEHPIRKWLHLSILMVWGIGFCLIWWKIGFRISKIYSKNNIKKLTLYIAWIISAVFFRFIFHYLPEDLFDADILSPHYFALNEYYSSLGYFTLNSFLVFGFTVVSLRTWSSVKIKSSLHTWILLFFLIIILSIIGYYLFLNVFNLFITHSKIYFELSDLRQMNTLTVVLYLNVLLLTLAGSALLNRIAEYWYKCQKELKIKIHYIGLIIAIIFIFFAFYFPADRLPFVVTGLIFLIFILIRPIISESERSFASLVLAAVTWALCVNAGIAYTFDKNLENNMKLLATKLSPERDLVTEYSLVNISKKILSDTTIWNNHNLMEQPGLFRNEIVPYLMYKYFNISFRSHDVEMAIFNENEVRLDQPRIFGFNELFLSSLTETKGKIPQTTLSRYFTRIDLPGNAPVYVGNLPLTVKKNNINLKIEIRPRALIEGKLYPRLLSDDRITQRINGLSSETEAAFYYEKEFVKKVEPGSAFLNESSFDFPLVLHPNEALSGVSRFRRNQYFYEYLRTENNNLTVMVRAVRRNFSDHFTAISILFYFYMLYFSLYYFTYIYDYFQKKDIDYYKHSLIFKIRIYLLTLTIIPLAVVGFLTTSFLNRFFHLETRSALRQNLELIKKHLQDDISFTDQLSDKNSLGNEYRETLIKIGNLISNDINIFSVSGKLLSTTKPDIYHNILVSPYINPNVLREYQKGYKAEKILTEKIGNLYYESGYLPLTKLYSNEVIGYINLPFVSKQDTLFFRTERILAYLLNVYTILFLIILVVSLIITRSLTRPIRLLQSKLDNFRLDDSPSEITPVEIKMKNEIGALFNSYNTMLVRLFESKNKIALREREKAYKIMAQQLAHEIKNPLTPMQLHMQMIQRNLKEGYELTDEYLLTMSETILGQINKLNHIAGTFAKLDSVPSPQIRTIDPNELLSDLYELYRDADEAEVVLVPSSQKILIHADIHQLNQVLVNLIKNSLESMDKRGKIVLSVHSDGVNGILKIADNGKGIPNEIKENLYEFRFTTKKTGSGIGLYLSRKMVLNMKGSIRFESQLGTGTTFYLSFPLSENS